MEGHPEDRRNEINLTGWWVALGVIVAIFAGCALLSEVVLVDRLTLHNTTTDPIVFAGARGESGSIREADVFLDPCETAEFEWGPLGWTTDELDSFEPIENAVRIEMTIRPPSDHVSGARYVAAVTKDGAHEVDPDEPNPACVD